jgi:hypothetical protein
MSLPADKNGGFDLLLSVLPKLCRLKQLALFPDLYTRGRLRDEDMLKAARKLAAASTSLRHVSPIFNRHFRIWRHLGRSIWVEALKGREIGDMWLFDHCTRRESD